MKRVFSLLLVVAMTLSLATPIMAVEVTEYSEDILVKLEGREATVGGKDGVIFDWNMQMSSFQGTQILAITYDSSKLTLTNTAGQAQSVTAWSADLPPAILQVNYSYNDETGETSGLPGLEGYSRTLKGNANTSNHKNTLYISFGTGNSGSKQVTDFADALKRLGSFRFQLNDGVNYSDLDSSTVRWATIPEMSGEFKIDGAVVVSSADGQIAHNVNSSAIQYKFKTEPTIAYPNSDVINLNGVKVDASQRYVNVPVSLPSADPDVTVQASAQGYSDSDCADGTEIESGVTFEYSVAMKDGSDLPETVSINETTGLLTIEAGAPEAVVTITAAGTYAENGSTASGTFDVSLRHGDAGEKNEEDPTEPKKEEPKKANDVTPVASGVAVYEDDKQVTSSATGVTNYAKAIAVPKTDSVEVTFEGKIVDQYGDIMTDETGGSWAATKSGNPYSGTNPGFNNGIVTVAPAVAQADKGTYNYTFSHSTFAATVEVTVDDTAITWPTLSRNTMTYGETVSKLTTNKDGSYTDSDGNVHTEVDEPSLFSWDTPNATPDVATTKVVMKFDNGVEADAKTKDYDITVSQAKQKIVIDPSIELEGTGSVKTLEIPLDETIDLNTIVENISVQDEDGKNLVTDTEVTYSLTDNEGGLVAMTGDQITGVTQSTSGTDVAKLKISAAGTANYEAADDVELELYVAKPVLKATIAFDTTAPVYGKKITATVTEHVNQSGSLTADVTYQWGHVTVDAESGKITAFEAIGGDSHVQNLVPNGDGTATVEYNPAVSDIGATLGLRVITPTDKDGYGWIHSVQDKMAAPVARATWGTITGSVKSVTTTTVTVNGEKDAWFAIALKNAPVTAAEGETEEAGSDGHKWVESKNGADVEFTQDDAGNALMPNTEYTVFMKKEADGYDTATTSFDTATAKESITPQPNPDNPDNPIPPTITGVTVTAAIDETAGLKFGQTLTASVTVTDTVPHDPVITIDADQWEYKWYRVTPAEGENPETEEVIKTEAGVDYVGNTYTLAENDIDKVIRVKATTKDTCEYIAYANDDTSGKIAKADGDVLTADGFAATKATGADATDGTITIAAPADLTKKYEYRLKAAEGTEENTWTEATIVDGVLVGNLGVGTYEVRIKETATKNASNAIELDVQTAGFDITGVIYSYNAANEIHYTLYTAYDTETHTGTALSGHENVLLTVETPESTAGDHEQAFTIKSVPSGTYTLVMTKTSHVDLRIYNVVVGSEALDLTKYVARFEMGAGDMNADGYITAGDGNLVTLPSNFGKDVGDDGVNPVADMNGDGSVTAGDGNIVTLPKHFGYGADHFEVTIDYSAS